MIQLLQQKSLTQNMGRKPGFIKEIIGKWPFYLMILPGLLVVAVFNYIPMFGAVIAFKEYDPIKGILGSKWIGFKNFEFFFKTQDAFRVTFNTIFYNITIMISVTVVGLLLAILLSEIGNRFLSSTYKGIMILPVFLSWIVIQYIVFALLSTDHGLVNSVLKSLGFNVIQWYAVPEYWRFIMPFAYLWKMAGYYSVLYVASIAGIPNEYYEAAEIDGAGKVKQIFYITLPLLAPVAITLILLWCGRIFIGGLGDWTAFYAITNDSGILYPATDVIDTYVFRSLRVVNDIGMSSAVGFYQSVVGFVLVLVFNKIAKKVNPDGGSLF